MHPLWIAKLFRDLTIPVHVLINYHVIELSYDTLTPGVTLKSVIFHSIIMMIIDFEFTIFPFVLYLPVELVKMEKCNIL